MKIYFLCLFLYACNAGTQSQTSPENNTVITQSSPYVLPKGQTVLERFGLPTGFKRVTETANSYGDYLRSRPLKAHGSEVFLFNGEKKRNQNAHIAVLDITVGSRDLQQCADAVMRLRADYLRKEKRYEELSFNFTNGFKATYSMWRSGNIIQVKPAGCNWIPSSIANGSDESYDRYLQTVFSYAGSLSLSKQLKPVKKINELQSGDVWIRGGSPGHAVIVMDVAIDKNGKKIFLLAQSYMPAQEIHILLNPSDKTLSPWYSLEDIDTELITPEYVFTSNELMRFE